MGDVASTGVAGEGPSPSVVVPQQLAKESPGITLRDIQQPELRPLNARLSRERTRTILAATFALSLLFTLGASFFGAMTKWAPVKDWLQLVLPAETALFGSALGFYFGQNRESG
jgi:hypothetical protein